jgi:hypothetical protein
MWKSKAEYVGEAASLVGTALIVGGIAMAWSVPAGAIALGIVLLIWGAAVVAKARDA